MKKGVIVYLARKNDINLLLISLRNLYHYYNKKFNHHVNIYHDDLDKVSISYIMVNLHKLLGFVPTTIRFIQINFEIPAHIDKSLINTNYRVGYMNMCRFFAGELYKRPEMQQYDYYMRMDTDSFILSDINYDLFEKMKENDQIYAYMSEYDVDSVPTSDGFKQFSIDYIKKYNINVVHENLQKITNWNLEVFYTNFVLGNLSFFRSPEYVHYFNEIDQTGNFYYKRWGDHLVHWFACHMFLEKNKVVGVKDIAYQHGSWVKNTHNIDKNCINFIPEPYKSHLTQYC